ETLTINETAPAAGVDATVVDLTMGAGMLSLQGGAEGLAEGEIRYNVAEWKPTVTRDSKSLSITQGQNKNSFSLPGGSNLVNDWSLKLGSSPMALTIDAGAYQGTLALGGLPLRSLTIHDGAGDSTVSFDSPNPEPMDTLTYQTGASKVSLQGLANANAQTINFTGGAGDYELDFSGKLERDVTVEVQVGVSSLRLVVPVGSATVVNISGGLKDVKTTGTWAHTGDSYSQAGTGHTITINVDIGVGSLELAVK
ncbi:MAG TPA: toast rack family protein, partial [Chloroflexia bacterium]|nr:toast rack family protein [Chloroflexia bacterium]